MRVTTERIEELIKNSENNFEAFLMAREIKELRAKVEAYSLPVSEIDKEILRKAYPKINESIAISIEYNGLLTRAFIEGCKAYKDEESLAQEYQKNPYEKGSKQAKEWVTGFFIEADLKRVTG
jgi:hypothetical protein